MPLAWKPQVSQFVKCCEAGILVERVIQIGIDWLINKSQMMVTQHVTLIYSVQHLGNCILNYPKHRPEDKQPAEASI